MRKLLGILPLIILLCSCSLDNTAKPQTTKYLELQDFNGPVSVPFDPQRIAVLDYAALDTLDVLGSGDKVVAMPKSKSILPDQFSLYLDNKIIDTGSVVEVNFELLNNSNAELIITGLRMGKLIKRLNEIAPTYLFEIDTVRYYDSFKEQNLNLAKIVNQAEKAQQILQDIDDNIKEIRALAKNKTALVVLVNNNKTSVYGVGSRFGAIHDIFGFKPVDESITVSTHGQVVTYEYILQQNPDYIFVIDRLSAISEQRDLAQRSFDNVIIKKTQAFKNKKIIYLNSKNWYLMNGGLGTMQNMIKEVRDALK